MKGVWLEDLTWREAKSWFDRDAVVVVPIGTALKEHGHHLPLCADYVLARAFCDGVAADLPVVIAPVIPEQDFGPVGALGAEDEHGPGERILPQLVADQRRNAVMALTEVHRLRRNEYPHPVRQKDHTVPRRTRTIPARHSH